MAESEYTRKLNEWHLELAIVQGAFERVSLSIEDHDMAEISHVLSVRFHDLVEKCPFPERSGNEA